MTRYEIDGVITAAISDLQALHSEPEIEDDAELQTALTMALSALEELSDMLQ